MTQMTLLPSKYFIYSLKVNFIAGRSSTGPSSPDGSSAADGFAAFQVVNVMLPRGERGCPCSSHGGKCLSNRPVSISWDSPSWGASSSPASRLTQVLTTCRRRLFRPGCSSPVTSRRKGGFQSVPTSFPLSVTAACTQTWPRSSVQVRPAPKNARGTLNSRS